MKTLADLVLLDDPRLYEVCAPVTEADLPLVAGWVAGLHQVMQKVRARYGFGRGIAAPQLGIRKRLVYLHLDGQPHVLLNPELSEQRAALFEL
jgi:peptide deformylase